MTSREFLRSWAALSVCLLIMFHFSGAGFARAGESEREVEVEGYAFVKGFPDAAVIELAREAARIRAIEEGGETIIERHSESENFELIRDVVLTDTKGLLKSQEWLLYPGGRDHQVRGDRLYVKLRAVVRVGRIDSDIPAIAEVLRRRGQPRLVLLMKEDTGSGVNQGTAEAEIESLLIEKHFRVLDAEMLDVVSEREREDLLDDPDRAAALLRRLSYDYAVTGVLRARKEEPFSDGGVEMERYSINARFVVVDRHLGGKLAVVQHSFHTRPSPPEASGAMLQTALATAGKNIGRELLSRLLDQLGRQTGTVEIAVSNANRRRLDALRESLLQMGGKQNFVTRSMRKGEALVEFESQFPIDVIASYIEEQGDVPLELTDQLESKLLCEFVDVGGAENRGGVGEGKDAGAESEPAKKKLFGLF